WTIRSRARFQSAGLRQNGCGNCSGSEIASPGPRFAEFIAAALVASVFIASGFVAPIDLGGKPWRDLAAAACSAFSTDANRSLISVPVYKSNSCGLRWGMQVDSFMRERKMEAGSQVS